MSATWSIRNLDYYVEKDGHNKVVYDVHWTCTQTDPETNTFVSHEGSSHPQLDDLSNFTPFENLSEEQLISWVKEQLTDRLAKKIEDKLLAKLNAQLAPVNQVESGLPWSS